MECIPLKDAQDDKRTELSYQNPT